MYKKLFLGISATGMLFAAEGEILTHIPLSESSPIVARKEKSLNTYVGSPLRPVINADEPVPEPNRMCQLFSSILSCAPALCSLCTKRDDYRECCPLHRTYVEPFELDLALEENLCCHCSHFFCPCVTPQVHRVKARSATN